MAKKTVLGGLNIGPDVELLILVGGGLFGLYWLWTTYGSSALSSIESDVSGLTGSGTATAADYASQS